MELPYDVIRGFDNPDGESFRKNQGLATFGHIMAELWRLQALKKVEFRPFQRPELTKSGIRRSDSFFGQQSLKFTALIHVRHDVAAANELTFDVELRYGRPL